MKKKKSRTRLNRLIHFLTYDIWRQESAGRPHYSRFYYRSLRILLLASKGFGKDNCFLRASALTYYSMLSIVPVLGMIFGIAQGFGFRNALVQWLRQNLAAQQEVVETIIEFVDNLLGTVNGGVIAGAGLLVLIWTALQLLTNIEESLNIIFGVNKARIWVRKFTDYLSIIITAPILIFISSGITVFVTGQLESLTEQLGIEKFVAPLVEFIGQIIPYLLIWLMLILVYMILPNLKVRFKSALIAGIFAGALYQITMWVYVNFQIGVSRYSTIYSALAALPLFMVWLQVSWFIFLFGAEIASAHQNIERYMSDKEQITYSISQKKLLGLVVAMLVIKRFTAGDAPPTMKDIVEQSNIPEKYLSSIMASLIKARIICRTTIGNNSAAFLPCQNINRYDMAYVMKKLEEENQSEKEFFNSEDLRPIKKVLKDIEMEVINSSSNKKLVDI